MFSRPMSSKEFLDELGGAASEDPAAEATGVCETPTDPF